MDADVVVVGAGLAGLAAARAVRAAGRQALVVEARDRVGGRLWAAPLGAALSDRGGQWVGAQHDRVRALAAELGLALFPTFSDGRKLVERDGVVRSYRFAPPLPLPSLVRLLRLIRRLDRARLHGDSAAAALRAATRDERVTDFLDAVLRGMCEVETAQLSLTHLQFYLRSHGGFFALSAIRGGAQQDRFADGAPALARALARDTTIRLGAPVTAITDEADGVAVATAATTLRARRAVVAVPPPLVARIALAPELPPARRAVIERLVGGDTIKVHLAYDRPFWRARGLSGEAVSVSGPVGLAFDDTSADGRQPALVAFARAHHAVALRALGRSERQRAVSTALARLFGDEAAQPTAYLETDWPAEPWSLGCHFVPPAGDEIDLAHVLGAPHGRVHFAGAETSVAFHGYMEGAIRSGERAAAEALRALS
jgi:monoamine oxidase